MDSIRCMNYIRILAEDKPRVLASIATRFADNNVSIKSVLQRATDDSIAQIVWLTHEAAEPDVTRSLEEIRALPVVKRIGSWIRVEE